MFSLKTDLEMFKCPPPKKKNLKKKIISYKHTLKHKSFHHFYRSVQVLCIRSINAFSFVLIFLLSQGPYLSKKINHKVSHPFDFGTKMASKAAGISLRGAKDNWCSTETTEQANYNTDCRSTGIWKGCFGPATSKVSVIRH